MHFARIAQPPFGVPDLVYIKVMDRRRNARSNPELRWFAGFWLASNLAACEPIWAAPETRARDFIEALVTSPAEMEKLRDIAKLSSEHHPEELLDDLSARVGLNYLRAMQARDVPLKFVQGESRRLGEARRTVKVHVTYLQPGTPTIGEVRFLVRIEKTGQDRWHIARVTGDN
jgi:hypothetical protein